MGPAPVLPEGCPTRPGYDHWGGGTSLSEELAVGTSALAFERLAMNGIARVPADDRFLHRMGRSKRGWR